MASFMPANGPKADDVDLLQLPTPASPDRAKDGPVTWMSLPRKGQLAVLFIARVVDFLQIACLQTYVFYQLKSLDSSLSDAQVSTQAGMLQGCFTGAQVLTAMLWGKAADASWCGRKMVLVIGLSGTAISCVGYGFATSFFWAALWRVLGGGINGTVGIIRTTVSEIVKERKYQSRAFLILPLSFNVASFLGPIIGGYLADPAESIPRLFGAGGVLAFQWIEDYPYALPSVLNALLLSLAASAVFFFLEETSVARRDRVDYGQYLAARIKQALFRHPTTQRYSRLHTIEDGPGVALQPLMSEYGQEQVPSAATARRGQPIIQLPFRRIWTRNVVLTLVTLAFYDFHLGAFANLWSLFLSTPRAASAATPSLEARTSALSGGLGMPVSSVGIATCFLGIIGMALQLLLYPWVHAQLGTLRCFRYFLPLFPVAYFLAPLLAVLPSASAASGGPVWAGIVLLLVLHVAGRTFTLPASIILLNNCSPHPSILGTVHGLGQSMSAAFRTVGPVVGGWWYGAGLDAGMVQAGWWEVAGVSMLGCVVAIWIYEGSGHEVYLEGEQP